MSQEEQIAQALHIYNCHLAWADGEIAAKYWTELRTAARFEAENNCYVSWSFVLALPNLTEIFSNSGLAPNCIVRLAVVIKRITCLYIGVLRPRPNRSGESR
mgnify:CR=1 FL=1